MIDRSFRRARWAAKRRAQVRKNRERDSSTPRGESLMRKYLNSAVVMTASAAISLSMIYVII